MQIFGFVTQRKDLDAVEARAFRTYVGVAGPHRGIKRNDDVPVNRDPYLIVTSPYNCVLKNPLYMYIYI